LSPFAYFVRMFSEVLLQPTVSYRRS
jgi:hypothetical protein